MKKTKQAAAAETPQLPSPAASFKRLPLILGIITFFLFAGTISNGYNLDDELVTRNHKLTSKGLEAVGEIFTSPYYSDAMGYSYGYRPMVHLSFAVEHQLFGEKAGISHFINVLLFAFSVVLFFKLLLKWTGENGIALALTAAALFAVHPVHTEVVASIKNRDEILAFLFVLLSALSLQKFSEKDQKWLSLGWALIFFAAAMLSKKSVYPMAVIIPSVLVLLHQIPLRKTVLISCAVILPAAVIGSELVWTRLLAMVLIPAVAIAAIRLLKVNLQSGKSTFRLLADLHIASVISWGILFLAIWKNDPLFCVAALLFSLLVLFTHYRWGIIQLMLQSLAISYVFQLDHFMLLAIFTGAGYTFYSFFVKRKKEYITGALTLVGYAMYIISHLDGGSLMVLGILIFCFLIFWKTWWGVGFALATSASFFFPGYSEFYIIAVLVISAGKLISDKTSSSSFLGFLPLALLTLAVATSAGKFRQPVLKAPSPALVTTEITQNSEIREGRKLELVENTLMAPHTVEETIGTGFSTLGEYMRLMVFPYELSFYYGYARTNTVSLDNPFVWISVVIYGGLLFLALWQLKRRPFLSVGIFWYLLSILLFSNWLELVAGMVGERLAFTASAGFCLFIAALLLWIKPSFSFRKPGLAEWSAIIIILAFGTRSVVRNTNWKDPLTLMGNDIQHLGNSSQANNLYALNLMRTSVEDPGQTREEQIDKQQRAIYHFDRALAIWPDFFNAAYDKGRAGMASGDTLAAIAGFERAVAIGNANFTDPYYLLGDLYLSQKRNKDFLALSKKIYDISKDSPNGYSILARGYFINGHKDSSVMVLQKGVEKFPENADLKKNLELVKNS